MISSLLTPQNRIGSAKMGPKPGPIAIKTDVVELTDSIDQHAAAWDDLAAHASEPNVFMESWMIRPGTKYFRGRRTLFFLFVYATFPDNAKMPPILIGFFPLDRQRTYRGLPISCISIWKHGEAFLATPLIRKGYELECLQAFFRWLREDRRSAALVEFPQISGDGPIYQSLQHLFFYQGILHHPSESFNRAFLHTQQQSANGFPDTLSSNKRRDLKRKQRRLAELGQLEYRKLSAAGDDVDYWLDAFLHLEASGWKGQANSAILSRKNNLSFFREMALEGYQRGQLLMLGLFLDDRPIALRCNFVSGSGSFFFKPAYDETLAQYSPGVLLELEMIRYLQDHPEIDWMDSCTSPNNALMNSLWQERRTIHTIVAATGKPFSGLTISLLPLLRWVNRKIGNYDPTKI